MFNLVLLSGLLCFFAGSALAQVPAPNLEAENFKQRLRAQYLHSDTAQAIITLYGRRQAGGASWIVSSTLAAARLAISSGDSAPVGGGYVTTDNSGSGVAFLAVVPFVGYGVSKLVRFSNGRLEQMLTAYAAGQLPRSTRRRLKPRFFVQPIIQYKTVESAPAR